MTSQADSQMFFEDRRFVMVPTSRLTPIMEAGGSSIDKAAVTGFVVLLHVLAEKMRLPIEEDGRIEIPITARQMSSLLPGSDRKHSTLLKDLETLGVAKRVAGAYDTKLGAVTPGRVILLGDRHPHVQITGLELRAIANEVSAKTHLSVLGHYAVIVEACSTHRYKHGESVVSLSARDITDRTGLSPSTARAQRAILSRARVLHIVEQYAKSGYQKANSYELRMPNEADLPPAEMDDAPRRDGRRPPPSSTTPPAEMDDIPRRDATTPLSSSAPSRAGQPGQRPHELQQHPPTPQADETAGEQPRAHGAQEDQVLVRLCQQLASNVEASTSPTVHTAKGGWIADRQAWLQAAHQIVHQDQYAPRDLEVIIDGISRDEFLAGQYQTMPAVAKNIHRIAARVRTARSTRTSRPTPRGKVSSGDRNIHSLGKMLQLARSTSDDVEGRDYLASQLPDRPTFVAALDLAALRTCQPEHWDGLVEAAYEAYLAEPRAAEDAA